MTDTLHFNDDTGCLTVLGELTIYQANATVGGLRSAFATGALSCIDLDGVTELDTAGLQLLLAAMRRAGAGEQPLALVNPSQPVRDVLVLSGVEIFS